MKAAGLLLVAIACGWHFNGNLRAEQPQQRRPNILLILADDLGYGDVSCYNDAAKVQTPNLNALASEGIRFTDAHSPATVCTPTRYSILTGRMAFRTGYRGVFTGAGGPCLIQPDRLTLPQMLRDAGYRTAMVGKWHVGLTFFDDQGKPIHQDGLKPVQRIDFDRPFQGGPVDRGFDSFFGTACCPTTDWLYAYLEGNRVPHPPTMLLDKSDLPKHDYSRDNRRGMVSDDFDLQQVDLKFLEKSQQFIRDHVQQHPEQPFFLFHSMQAVHLPSFPAPRFQGKSNAGPHGDFILEMDWIVGQLMNTLQELQIDDQTLVVFASDNGPEVPTVIAMRRDHQHDGARPWRGVKRDNWEGGHRTPLIVRWPEQIESGRTSDQLIGLTDLFATCAAIVGTDIPENAAEDSVNMLSVWQGTQGAQPVRSFLLQQTMSGKLSIRKGDWKLLDHQGSGGNNYQREGRRGMQPYALPELDPDAPRQLYNLASDPGETTNLYSARPKIASDLKHLLDQSVATANRQLLSSAANER